MANLFLNQLKHQVFSKKILNKFKMQNNLKSKIAVITGCNKGIGKAILSEYAKNGVNCISCVSVSDDFKAFCQNLSENNVKVSIVKIDLSDNKLVSESVKEIFKISKKIDILVNNAGSYLILCFYDK